jgi:hypothetical protein
VKHRLGFTVVVLLAAFPCGALFAQLAAADRDLFGRKHLVAWCIVPFNGRPRSPSNRAEMHARLGFTKFAYDYRAEHIPQFEETKVRKQKDRGNKKGKQGKQKRRNKRTGIETKGQALSCQTETKGRNKRTGIILSDRNKKQKDRHYLVRRG